MAIVAMLASTLVAHEKFKIVGTVVKVHAEQLDVKSVDGSTYEMDLPAAAVVFRQNRKVARAELKAGANVIVNALGHDFFDLEVVEVHLVDSAAFSNNSFFWLAFRVSAAARSNSVLASSNRSSLNNRSARTPGR